MSKFRYIGKKKYKFRKYVTINEKNTMETYLQCKEHFLFEKATHNRYKLYISFNGG
jgi:hypothetical protein